MKFSIGKLFSLVLLSAALALSGMTGDVEVGFSRLGQVQDTVLRHLNQPKQTCYVGMFDFMDGTLAAKSVDLNNRGVDMRVVPDSRQAKGPHSEAGRLVENLGTDRVRVARGFKGGIMHHKFAMLDGKIVLAVSYNWTDSAREHNVENLLVMEGEGTAAKYREKWNQVWR